MKPRSWGVWSASYGYKREKHNVVAKTQAYDGRQGEELIALCGRILPQLRHRLDRLGRPAVIEAICGLLIVSKPSHGRFQQHGRSEIDV